MHKLRSRLPVILSVTALVVAVFGATPVGHAVDAVLFAKNAGKVDGLDASKTPKAGQLLALNGQKKFPASVVGGISSLDVLDGAKCTRNSTQGHVELLYSGKNAILRCIIPIAPDANEPNDNFPDSTLLPFPPDLATGTLPSGDHDFFTFTCQNTMSMMGSFLCSEHALFINTDQGAFDVYEGAGPPVVQDSTDYVIDPLTAGEQVWIDLSANEDIEGYTLTFALGDASP